MLLFGSTTLMMSSMEEMTVGSVEDDQNWDIQANVLFGGEDEVIQWVDDKGGYHERIITFPANPINDSRVISANGMEVLSTESSALIQLDLKEGKLPEAGLQTNQILIDEGLNHFLGWETGEIQTLVFGSTPAHVEICLLYTSPSPRD